MPPLNDIKLSHKLIGSYAVIILLVILLSVFALISMNRLQNTFTDYSATARESLVLADATQYLGDARRNAFKFRLTSDDTLRQDVKADIARLIELKESIQENIQDEDQKAILNGLTDKAQQYESSFFEAAELQSSINEHVAVLSATGTPTRKMITEIMETAFRDGDPTASYFAGRALKSLLLARAYASNYILLNDINDGERVIKELDSAQKETVDLLRELQNPTRRNLAIQVQENLALYKTNFESAFALTQQRNVQYDAMEELGASVLDQYTAIFKANEDKQIDLGNQATQKIQNVSISSVVVSLIIVIIAIAVALFMARMIVGALSNVTSIMSRLRKGDFKVNITGTERGDEIGEMSRAIEQFKGDAERSFLLKQMVDDMPTNVMTVDVKDGLKVNYINNTSLKTLSTLEEHLPVKADEVLGKSIDIFHKDPAHQAALLADPNNLPHRAKISVGPERMSLLVSAIRDNQNEYVGAMLTWDIITAKEQMGNNVENVVNILGSAVTELEATAQSMSAMAEQTQNQSTSVAAAAEEASANVSTVAASTEELTASIAEISKQMQESNTKTGAARDQANATNATVGSLKNAANKIGEVVTLINDIAEQTNLLALNATIEAARAGEAGKGFAVVANEVKGLASETASATEEISSQIGDIQNITNDAVIAIDTISKTIEELNSLAANVAAAVEEQSAATQEIARSVEQAAAGTQEVTRSISNVSQAAQETGNSAQQVLETSGELGQQSQSLQKQVEDFFKS